MAPFRRLLPALTVSFAAAAAAAGGGAMFALLGTACGSAATTTTISPITGILIRSDALVGSRGCGLAPTQLYKYVAVVVDGNGKAIAAGTYDCFADGSFQNLPIGNYTVEIFAFSKAAFDAQANDINAAAASSTPDLSRLRKLGASSTTTCRATQQQDIEVLAVCEPLRQTSVEIATDTFPTADGVGVSCHKDYLTVIAAPPTLADGTALPGSFEGGGGDAGNGLHVDCPASIQLHALPAEAAIVVELDLAVAGLVTAHTRCHATAAAGKTTKATCEPVERR